MSAEPADVQLRPRDASFRARVQFRKSHSGPPKMEGYLKKRSDKISLKWFWRKYWFVLDGKSLLYFKSQSNYNSLGTCKGLIDFGLVQAVRPTHHSKKTFAMEIVTRSDIIHLCADDEETRQVWVHALQGAIGIDEVSWPYGVQLDISPQLAALKSNERNCNTSSKLSSGWSPGLGDRRRKTASLLTYEHIPLETGGVDTERRPSSEGAIYHQISSDDDKPITPTKKTSCGMLRRARSFSIGFMAKKNRFPSLLRGRANTKACDSRIPSQAKSSKKQTTPCRQASENSDNDTATTGKPPHRVKTAPNPEDEHRITVALNVNPAYQEISKCTSLTVTSPEDNGQYAEVNETHLAMSDASSAKGEVASNHLDPDAQPRNSKESVDDFSLHIYQEVQRSSPSPVPSPRTVFLTRPRPVPEIPDAEDENESYYSSISEEDLRRLWSRRRGTETSETGTETADDSTYTTADPNDSAEELAEMDIFEDNPHIVVAAERPHRSLESLSSDAMKELREFLEYLGTDDGEGANKERPSVAKARELIAREVGNQTT